VARHAELAEVLGSHPGVVLRLDERVARHSALRIGGEVEAWVLALDEAAVKDAVAALRRGKLSLRPHDPLGDHYAREEGLAGAMLRLGPAFGQLGVEDDRLHAGAAVPLARLGVVAARHGLEAWAPLSRWPGTVGGWLSGADPARLAPLVHSVRALRGRSVVERSGDTLASLGSKAIVLGAVFHGRPDAPLPPSPPSPGSLTLQGGDVLRAMVKSRLPGLRLRSIRLASEQPGLVVNLGGGSSRDLDLVLKLVQDRLKRDHGVELEARLAPLGRPPKTEPDPRLGLY